MKKEIPKKRYWWQGHASSEGGPILIADVDDYALWKGDEKSWDDKGDYLFNLDGPLADKLPKSFSVSGKSKAEETLKRLIDDAKKMYPDLIVREQKAMSVEEVTAKAGAAIGSEAAMEDWLSAWQDHIEQGVDLMVGEKLLLHIDAAPDTDYARACDALGGEGFKIISFGKGNKQQGLVWDMGGPGTAYVAEAESKDSLVLASISAEKDKKDEAKDFVFNSLKSDKQKSVGKCTFSSGVVAIVWAIVSLQDLVDFSNAQTALQAAATQKQPVELNIKGIQGVGTLARLKPGVYTVSMGAKETKDWEVIWLVFNLKA